MKIIKLFYVIIFVACNFNTQKSTLVEFKCNNEILFKLEKSIIKKQDTLNYEEGHIYNVTTITNSNILAVCGGNAMLSEPKNGVLLDSSYVNGSLNLLGIEKGLYWRKYRNLMYSNVQAKDTSFYNKIINRNE